jgi:hypothetical protein
MKPQALQVFGAFLGTIEGGVHAQFPSSRPIGNALLASLRPESGFGRKGLENSLNQGFFAKAAATPTVTAIS